MNKLMRYTKIKSLRKILNWYIITVYAKNIFSLKREINKATKRK